MSLFLSLSIILSSIEVNVYAAVKESLEIAESDHLVSVDISDINEFEELAKKSVDESYSKGKRFRLTNDLNFENKEFTPISIMAGSFDGNGHTIRGITVSEARSETGFVRRITESGSVENLDVSADIRAERNSENLGGIVGENDGLVRNVKFFGRIISYRATGGIAGHQSSSGNIIACVNNAEIISQRRSGGIIGFNEGTVSSCTNNGSVNTSSKTAHEIFNEGMKEDFAIGFPDLRVIATGGIAGVNMGEISSSINNGDIGNGMISYLTGGIAGYTKGYIGYSVNNAGVNARKNTGGIAGLFEPYTLHQYEDDSFDKVKDELDDLSEMVTELNRIANEEDDKIQAKVDIIRAETDAVRAKISEDKAYFRNKNDIIEEELKGKVDRIRATIDGMDFDFKVNISTETPVSGKSKAEEIANLTAALISALVRGAYVDIPETLTNIAIKAEDLRKSVKSELDQIKGAGKKLGKKSKKIADQMEELSDEMDDLRDYSRRSSDEIKCDQRNRSDEINDMLDRIHAEIDELHDLRDASDSRISDQRDLIKDKKDDLSDHLKDGFDEMDDLINDIKETDKVKEIFDDLSDDENDTVSAGLIIGCQNNASVYGDINNGGIVGGIDFWLETESESEVITVGDPSLNYRSTKKATIINSENFGDIIGRNDYNGGVVGRAESGAVINCGNYGNILSKDGDYTGGIAGYSAYTIRNSYCVTSVSGNAEIGGIAGKGKNIINNKAIVAIDDNKQHCGCIAGSLEDDGEVSGNEFWGDYRRAINGKTVASEASEKSREEIISEENLPDSFRKLSVTFVADDKVIKRIRVSYNESIDKKDIPEAPVKAGYDVEWPRSDFNSISHNIIVEAEYRQYKTSIATDDEDLSFMMEGLFYPDSRLDVKSYSAAGEEDHLSDSSYRLLSKLQFTVSSERGTLSGNHSVRIRDLNKRDTLAVYRDKSLEPLDCIRDGDYLVADVGACNEIYMLRKKNIFLDLFE